MRKFLFVTMMLTLGLARNSFLSAQGVYSNTTVPSYKSDINAPSETERAGEKEKQNQAADMILSAREAKDYVGGLDREQYAQSWESGDPLFQHTITKEQWIKALDRSRKRLGKMNARNIKDQRPAWNPAGLPRGAYMVVEFDTSFQNAPYSGELLTLRKGPDGKWRVLTYQVN
jgi:Protein of unknown function (DUF4019)